MGDDSKRAFIEHPVVGRLMWGRLFEHMAGKWLAIQLAVLCNKCSIESFSPTEVTLTPHTVSIALPGSIVDMYLCCHASHWFHVSSSAPPTVPRPYMGDYLRWTFIDKDRAFTLGV